MQPDSSIANFHKALACLWESFFHDFIEIAHDCPTFMRGTYLSQLDHVWTNILPAILLDLSPSAAVSWQFGDHLGNASDHTPVHLAIGAESGTRVSSVPRWVPKHPEFKANCIKLFEQVYLPPGSPFETLQRHKAILREAARLTVLQACRSNSRLDIEQKIYWSMILLRHRHDLSDRQVVNATKSYKTLSQFLIRVNNGHVLDIRALSLSILMSYNTPRLLVILPVSLLTLLTMMLRGLNSIDWDNTLHCGHLVVGRSLTLSSLATMVLCPTVLLLLPTFLVHFGNLDFLSRRYI